MQRFEVDRLDMIERDATRPEWIPLRRRFGVTAFGVNAWSAAEPGDPLIPEHDEAPTGHEELYLVVAGHAVFSVDGEEVDAPAGTVLFVRDPAARRSARPGPEGATVVTVGAGPGEAFHVAPWEVASFFDRGDYAGVRRVLEPSVRANPRAAAALYNLACAEALLGEADAALDHLLRAAELDAAFAEAAREDEDFASLRDDPRFPR